MTTISRSNVRAGVSTQMHVAVPQVSVRRPPAYRVSLGLAAVILSLLGVDVTYDVTQEGNAVEVPFAARE